VIATFLIYSSDSTSDLCKLVQNNDFILSKDHFIACDRLRKSE